MTHSDAYLAGVRDTLALVERVGAAILVGRMPPLRREVAAAGLLAFADEMRGALAASEPTSLSAATPSTSGLQPDGSFVFAGQPKVDQGAARALGYTGDACTICASFSVKRNGSCLVCEACGSTTGCS